MRASTFTTYINAQVDPGLEAAFARQTSVAQSSYARITDSALAATRATAGLISGRSTAGLGTATRALNERVTATRAVTRAAADAERQTASLINVERRAEQQAVQTARANNGLTRALNTTATSLAVVEGRMSPVAGRLITLARAAEQLSGLQFGIAGFAAGLFAIGRAGNSYATLASRIRPFFDTQLQANRAMSDVVGIAQRSRASLESVVEIYARLTSQTDALGISQARVARATEIAAKAATLSGGTAQAREGALVQFSQALGANFRGSGQEFQSLAEGAPQLLQAIAAGFKNADGTIGTTIANLRKLAAEGELTSNQVLDALDRAAVGIDTKFSRLPRTLSSAGTEFANAITVMVGRLDQATGLTSTLAGSISLISRYLREAVAGAVLLGTAFVGVKAGNLAKQMAANVAGIIAQQQQVKALDAAWIRDAQVTASAYEARLVELEGERVAIGQSILAVEAKKRADQEASAAAIAAIEAETAAKVAAYNRQAQAAATVAVRAQAAGGAIVTGSQNVRGRQYPTFTTFDTASRQLDQNIAGAQRAQLAGDAAAYEIRAKAARQAAAADAELAARQGRLAGALRETQATTTALGTAQGRLGVATENVAKRVGLLRSAGSSLLAMLGGPWGIAFALATTAVYLLATAETAAEKATRLHEDAQRDFATIVDRTTGKVYDQVDALGKLAAAKKSQVDVQEQTRQFGDARGQLISVLRNAGGLIDRRKLARNLTSYANPVTGEVDSGAVQEAYRNSRAAPRNAAQAQLDRLITAFERGDRGSFAALADGVVKLAPQIQQLGRVLPRVTELSGTLRQSFDRAQQGRAQLRVLSGRAQDGDVALALGEPARTVSGPGFKPRSRAQIAAAAAADAARSPLEKAKAELAKVRAEKLPTDEAGQRDYQARLGAATEAVRTLTEAEREQKKQRREAASESRRQTSERVSDLRKLDAEQRRQGLADQQAALDAGMANLEERAPDLSRQQYLDARIELLRTYDAEVDKINGVNNESHRAADQQVKDARAVATARREITADFDKQVAIAKIVLAGGDVEAAALGKVLEKREQIGDAALDLLPILVDQGRQEQRINDLLASRQRIVGLLQGSVDAARDDFEQFLTGISNGEGIGRAAGNLFKQFQQRFTQIGIRQFTEELFAGSDEKVRSLITGRANVDAALNQYVDTLGRTETGTERLATATERAAERIDAATSNLSGGGLGSAPGGTSTPTIGAMIANETGAGGGAAALIAGVAASAAGKAVTKAGGAARDAQAEEIVVTGTRAVKQATQALKGAPLPSAKGVFNALGGSVGSNLDRLFDKTFRPKQFKAANAETTLPDGSTVKGAGLVNGSTFFKKIGDSFGTALQGAGQGAIASGFAKALGIKQSQTGAQIGGAIGSFLPIPGGAIIGGLVGGTIGGLFKKPKYGTSSVVSDGFGGLEAGEATGNSGKARTAATGAAKSVADGLASIASTLGAKISGTPNLTIGTYNDKYRVSTEGYTGKLKTGKNGVVDFGKDGQQEAIEYAIRYAVEKSVITGISQASINIIKSGQDLQKAIEKAAVIESIPKRLLQRTDPVRYAVQQLNDEFARTIDILREGKASAEQFADAQKLYELERADAIEQATKQASDAIDQFLKDMVGSSSSPLNKRTIYENASADLDSFRTSIASGKSVDQTALLTAARSFQDASRSLFGSNAQFFSDFEMLRSLLQKARDNAGTATNVSTLPGSPFDTASNQVVGAIDTLQSATTAATKDQTVAVLAALGTINSTLSDLKIYVPSAFGSTGALDLLPGLVRQS